MRAPGGSSVISRLAGAIAALFLWGSATAWAGGGGEDAGSFQPFLDGVCSWLGVTSCPQLPTLTQIVLESAGLQNVSPDFVRGPLELNICTVAGNLGLPPCSNSAVSAANPLSLSPVESSDLAHLTPLAFVSPNKGQVPQQAVPVPLGSDGNSFFYAVVTGQDSKHALDLFFDYTASTHKRFSTNRVLASFTFPLVVLNTDSSETPATATLQLTATCDDPRCVTGTVSGIANKPLSAAQLGIRFRHEFAPSPNSPTPHSIFEVLIPLVVTSANDPAYFGVTPPDNSNGATPGIPTFINQASGLPTAFPKDELGFVSKLLKSSVGIAPYAAPLCMTGTCPPPTTFFGFCATIADRPAVAAFLTIGTDGTTYVSSPRPGQNVQLPQCP